MPIRFAALASFALSASLGAQSQRPPQTAPRTSAQTASTLPANPPTTQAVPVIPLTPAQKPPNHAQVTYSGGNLSVSADNSSLNQILRQIGTDTGMKITGGVADERVFGQYGPAPPDQVLAALLDGTSSNMLIVHRDDDTPVELVLTPRHGGPTPPNPNAHAFDDRPEPQQEAPVNQAVQPSSEPAPVTPPVTPAGTPGQPAGTAPTDASQPDSPNGVRTPQQIYEQLQRLRTQQQQSTQPQATQPQ